MALSYQTAVAKGLRLAWDFVETVPQSPFTKVEHLEHHGWEIEDIDQLHGAPQRHDVDRLAMYHDLRISAELPNNWRVRIVHKYASQLSGGPPGGYRATDAFMDSIFNPCAIITEEASSAAAAGLPNLIIGPSVVPLQHWSDVVFLQWKQFCAYKQIVSWGRLRYIVQSNVTNDTTLEIVHAALQRAGLGIRPLRTAPGEPGPSTLPIDSEECQAILATPNGIGPARMLSQHKEALGTLMITAVTVFSLSHAPRSVSLCFHVAPAL